MGLFKKHKSKGEKFAFTLLVHSVGPLYGYKGNLIVSWQRGSHSGSTRAASPASTGEAAASYVLDERLVVPATLYEVRGRAPRASNPTRRRRRYRRRQRRCRHPAACAGCVWPGI